MTNPTDQRLIEHYIPIKAISAEASREKSIRHGHISTLHLWWARRPLVASRAAVFAALVQADAKPQIIDIDTNQPMTLNKFMIELCKWEMKEGILDEARRLIREAYPDNPPKVLDMFAGGGSIPLEALRLGAEAYALDLNPVAHIIELATLVYPQKYGKQLAEDVKKWGQWVLERVRAEVGDLYPLIPDPEYDHSKPAFDVDMNQPSLIGDDDAAEDADEDSDETTDPAAVPPGYLQPVAYLWTRTVTCPNPGCRATVPLVRQTWLKKKKNSNVALEMKPHPTENRMAFYVRKAADPAAFGFDPAGFSQRGNSVCYRCGTTVTSDYIKVEGKAGRMAAQMIAIASTRPGLTGKIYLSPDEMNLHLPEDSEILARTERIAAEGVISIPLEEIETNPRSMDNDIYGFNRWSSIFTPRQLLTLMTFAKYVRSATLALQASGIEAEYAKAIGTYLGLTVSSFVNGYTSLCRWIPQNQQMGATYARQSLPMVWDFAEIVPMGGGSGNIVGFLNRTTEAIQAIASIHMVGNSTRGSATSLPYPNKVMDAVITDPPYYDNVSYSNLSDLFYIWLKRLIGDLYPEHFSSELTPKKSEAIAAYYRHDDKKEAGNFYERMMAQAFTEANRVLNHLGTLVVVYAHKTTAGWSTLVESLRTAGFLISEAWPLDTEKPGRVIAQDTAALASSFFLVARKRDSSRDGDYLRDVQPEMQRIVKERVRFFLEQGVTGADLNIATVGAGLAPFTRYARVELPNGEELTAAAYLDDVQAEVIKVLLGEASKTDPVTQYAIMWRNYYGEAVVEFDEANTLARATGVELDSGPDALSRGTRALVKKTGSKVSLQGFETRGEDEQLGVRREDGRKAPLIDVLHRVLWLAEHDNAKIPDYIGEAQPDKYLLRLTAQALSGKALAGEPTPGAIRDERTREQRAIDTLLASWRRLIDENAGL